MKKIYAAFFFALMWNTSAHASFAAKCAERAFVAKGELDWKGLNVAKLCHGVRSEEQMESALDCAKRAYFKNKGSLDFTQESSAALCTGVPNREAVEEVLECATEAFSGPWAQGFDQAMTADLCRTPTK